MDNVIFDVEMFPIRLIVFDSYFKSIEPNGISPTDEQNKEMVRIIDERVSVYSKGLEMIHKAFRQLPSCPSEYDYSKYTVDMALLYNLQTTSDCMVASKYYLLANQDYDKRYMRGKLKVILNEGFKNLYGFTDKDRKKSHWGKVSEIVRYFPLLTNQHRQVEELLSKQANKSSWWKIERNIEVHLDPLLLYESRQEELNESKVMIETIQLFDALDIVGQFVWNQHACLTNWLNQLYLQHPELFKE